MARLDAELVSRGIARSRARAKEMIASGSVTVNGAEAKKASLEVSEGDIIESSEQELYVGRGAFKLEKAVEVFGIDLTGKVCLDIGASTGGFTDFMLRHGAARVIAVDVGHGQLAPSLRSDSRVTDLEGTDIRSLSVQDIGGQVDFICADVSFISLKMILPKAYELLRDGSCAAVLIKPQFEAGRSAVGKNGVVKDKKAHVRVLSELHSFAAETGFSPQGYTFSPVRGGSGNIEYLALLRKSDEPPAVCDFYGLVESAFRLL